MSNELLFAQVSEKNAYQNPSIISGKKRVADRNYPKNKVYDQYGADGKLTSNQFWNRVPFKFPTGNPEQNARYGGEIHKFIIRNRVFINILLKQKIFLNSKMT